MKTDAKTIAEIYRHMADNLDGGLFVYDGIEILINGGEKWDIIDNDIYKMDFKNMCYRIKPKTITVNGVEIPKPIRRELIDRNKEYFYPINGYSCHEWQYGSSILDNEILYAYLTKEEAIEASKKLFGIE